MGASNTVKTTSTVFKILETIHDKEGATPAEVAEQFDLSVSSIYKHLHTLEAEGYVVKSGGSYHISLRILRFGEQARKRMKIYHIAKPNMSQLAKETNELSTLLVEESGRGVILHRATSDDSVSLDTHAGGEVPLHCTGTGKSILAHLPTQRVDEIIERHGLPKFTENTITEVDALKRELETIRERGYAFDDKERLEGLRCVSVPLMNADGDVLGALSVSGPAARMRGTRYREDIPDHLLSAKNVIEMDTEYREF